MEQNNNGGDKVQHEVSEDEELDMQLINKIYNMISSKDIEMVRLGLTLMRGHGIDVPDCGPNGYGFEMHIARAELARLAYRLGQKFGDRARMMAHGIKSSYVSNQNFEAASFWRDVERCYDLPIQERIKLKNGESDTG